MGEPSLDHPLRSVPRSGPRPP